MISPEDFASVEAAAAPAFSADGRCLFHLRGAGQQQVWSLDLATGQVVQLTRHDERVSALRRAPGDDRLVHAIDAGGDERHQLWLLDGDVARPLVTDPAVIHGIGAWSPDGSRFAYTANDRDEAHFDVKAIDLADGRVTRLFEGTHEATVGAWGPAGRMVAVLDRSTADQRPVVLSGEGGGEPMPRSGAARYASLRWDGAVLLGLTDAGGREFVALCRIDLESGAVETVHAPAARDVEAWALSATGLLATIENDRGYSVLRIGPRDRDRPDCALPPGVAADPTWSPDGSRLAFAFGASDRPTGLWLWEQGRARPVWEPTCPPRPVPFDLVGWAGFEDLPIAGWFAVPPGPAPRSGWPAVVWVHGGPAMQCRPNFRPDMQALLAQGYAVLMPNVRGSTGYGKSFMEADDVEKRLDSVLDLAAGRNWLARQPGIDADRIAIMGQSYGGYMVLAAVTEFPELWRSAIDFYGIADFETLLAATGPWRRAHRAAEYGDPARHRALFDRISPIRHVNRVTVPMLVLHGRRDPRVAIGESEQVVAALRDAGRPVRYEVFDYAGHGFVRAADRERTFRAVADFLRDTL